MIIPPMLVDTPTIPQLAKKIGKPRRSLFRLLFVMHARDVAVGRRPWLFRHGARGAWRVNLGALRRIHSELFGYASSEEDQFVRIARLEQEVRVLKEAMRKVVRQLRGNHAQTQTSSGAAVD